MYWMYLLIHLLILTYSISQEICTRFFALLCFVVVIHWLIFPYPSGLLHWHCGNLTIAPVPAKQPWWIWINTSCEFIMNDCITTTKQSTTKPCAYFLGYTVSYLNMDHVSKRGPRNMLPRAIWHIAWLVVIELWDEFVSESLLHLNHCGL